MTPSPVLMQVRDSNAELISDATAIAAGREHACAVRAGGTVWCWGINIDGELGNNAPYPMAPAQLPPSPFAIQVLQTTGQPLEGITEIQAGAQYTCALDQTGGAWCWGSNSHNHLGDGTTTPRSGAAPVLTAMGGPPLSGASELQIGSWAPTCVRMGPDIWCWGQNSNGQLGDTTMTDWPYANKAITTTSFAIGVSHDCWVNAETTVSCAGWSSHGRLGNGSGPSYEGGNVSTPVTVLQSVGGPPLIGIAKVAAGAFSCAITIDQHAYCWGDDAYGQTGTGTGSTVPVQLVTHDGTPLAGIVSITAHYAHGCAHLTDGSVWCWGRNLEGEFGDGTFLNRGTPSGLQAGCR
jgi:alpha-tubulin suppressor-like RCC1 family protein